MKLSNDLTYSITHSLTVTVLKCNFNSGTFVGVPSAETCNLTLDTSSGTRASSGTLAAFAVAIFGTLEFGRFGILADHGCHQLTIASKLVASGYVG